MKALPIFVMKVLKLASKISFVCRVIRLTFVVYFPEKMEMVLKPKRYVHRIFNTRNMFKPYLNSIWIVDIFWQKSNAGGKERKNTAKLNTHSRLAYILQSPPTPLLLLAKVLAEAKLNKTCVYSAIH